MATDAPTPSRDFTAIYQELERIAWREAAGVESLEVLAGRADRENSFVLTRALVEAREGAELAGQAAALIKKLAPFEGLVRVLIENAGGTHD